MVAAVGLSSARSGGIIPGPGGQLPSLLLGLLQLLSEPGRGPDQPVSPCQVGVALHLAEVGVVIAKEAVPRRPGTGSSPFFGWLLSYLVAVLVLGLLEHGLFLLGTACRPSAGTHFVWTLAPVFLFHMYGWPKTALQYTALGTLPVAWGFLLVFFSYFLTTPCLLVRIRGALLGPLAGLLSVAP